MVYRVMKEEGGEKGDIFETVETVDKRQKTTDERQETGCRKFPTDFCWVTLQ